MFNVPHKNRDLNITRDNMTIKSNNLLKGDKLTDYVSFSDNIDNVFPPEGLNLSELEFLMYQDICKNYKIGSPKPFKQEDVGLIRLIIHPLKKGNNFLERLSKLKLTKDPALNANIMRFVLATKLYDSGIVRYPPINDLLEGCSEIGYDSILKKIKFYSFIKVSNSNFLEIPEDINEIPVYPVKDISEIFNYSWLIWIEEKPNDFFEHSFTEVKGNEELFRKYTRRFLKSLPDISLNLDLIKKEVLCKIKNSFSFEGPMWLSKGIKNNNTFSEERGNVRRVIIPVSPANTRDTVVNKIPDLNSIMYIERVLFEILDKLDLPTYTTSEERFLEKWKDLQQNDFVWCRDFEKEGLTRPRYINRVILQEFNRRFNLDFPENFFERYIVEWEKEFFRPTRGTGLGMANSIVTFLQLILHDAIFNEISSEEHDFSIVCNHLCLNDDNIVSFSSEELRNYYINIELRILEILDLKIKKSKSFSSWKGGIFLERYYSIFAPEIGEKKSFIERTPQAKSLNMIPLLTWDRYGIPYLSEVQKSLPKALGGVLTEDNKSSFLLNDFEHNEDISILISMNLPKFTEIDAYEGYSTIYDQISFKDKYQSPYNNCYPDLFDIIKEEEKEQFYFLSNGDMIKKFCLVNDSPNRFYDIMLKHNNNSIKIFHEYKSSTKKLSSFTPDDILKKLYSTGSYFVNPKHAEIILEKSDLEYVSLKDYRFFTSRDKVQSLINLRKKGEGENSVLSRRKERFFKEVENSFPFPKDPKYFNLFIANFSDWKEARDQLDKTGCLPLLRKDWCRPYCVERSNYYFSRTFFEWISKFGPMTDLSLTKFLDDLLPEIKEEVFRQVELFLLESNETYQKKEESSSDDDEELVSKYRDLLRSSISLLKYQSISVPEIDFYSPELKESLKEKYELFKEHIRFSGKIINANQQETDEAIENHLSWLNYFDIPDVEEGDIILPSLGSYESDMTLNQLVKLADGEIFYHPLSLKAIAINRFIKMNMQKKQREMEELQRSIPSTVIFNYNIINGFREDVIEDYTPTEESPPPEVIEYEDPELNDLANFINN